MTTRLRISMPPDPNPRTPRFKPPPGACDTHCHVFGPPDVFPYAATRPYTPPAAPIDHLAHIDARLGVGQRPFRLLLDLLADPKFWVKIAGISWLSHAGAPWDEVVPFARAALEAAPDRALWGTNWPHSMRFEPGTAPNDGDLVDFIPRYAPEPELQKKLLVENPARLFGFG